MSYDYGRDAAESIVRVLARICGVLALAAALVLPMRTEAQATRRSLCPPVAAPGSVHAPAMTAAACVGSRPISVLMFDHWLSITAAFKPTTSCRQPYSVPTVCGHTINTP